MANSGIYEDDYLTDPGSAEESEVESLFDESPADGYFEQRPHPQDTFVESSPAGAKAREAAEETASSSRAVPPSQISSTATSPRSVAWTDVETPMVSNVEAPPPDYESATANQPPRNPSLTASSTQSRGAGAPSQSYASMPQQNEVSDRPWPFGNNNNPFSSGFPFGPNGSPGFFGPNNNSSPSHNTNNQQAQSMSDPVSQQTTADEEIGLLTQRRKDTRRRPFWRQCCKPMSTCNAILIIAIIILVILVAGSSDDGKTSDRDGHGDTPDEKPISPPVSPSPTHSPVPFQPPYHSSCSFDHYSEPTAFDFKQLGNFTFMELMESSNYFTGGIEGRIDIVPAEPGQDSDIKLWISYGTSKPFYVARSNIVKTDDSLTLNLPDVERTHEGYANKHCMGVYVRMQIRLGVRLENFELATGNLDVVVDDGLFNHNAGQESLSVFGIHNHSTLSAVRGSVTAEYWSSRETVIDVISGSIKGTFALRDLLSLKSASGSIAVHVDPKAADQTDIRPARFTTSSHSGSIAVHFPTRGEIPSREYRTRIESSSSSVSGTYFLGALTSIHSQSGTIRTSLLPCFDNREPSRLHVESTSSSQHVDILSPYEDPGDFARLSMEHKYTSVSGSLHVTYPQEWEGSIEGETLSGSISVKGKDVEIVQRGKIGPIYEHLVARKGDGQGRIGFKTTSGSVDLKVGDL